MSTRCWHRRSRVLRTMASHEMSEEEKGVRKLMLTTFRSYDSSGKSVISAADFQVRGAMQRVLCRWLAVLPTSD